MENEKQRERLVELLKKADENTSRKMITDYNDAIEDNADYLLANNVVVLPCKVGDRVYSITECSCENIDGVHTECEFYGYGEDDRICLLSNGEKCPYQYRVEECYVLEMNALMFARQWGKTVFLSREEAENVLKERKDKRRNELYCCTKRSSNEKRAKMFWVCENFSKKYENAP